MARSILEQRVALLENEIADMKRWKTRLSHDDTPWWERIRGDFKDDPDYTEAMRLGREYRESLRPKGDDGQPE
jgi:hypothetical protein